ncbi:MAG: hypothetical protein COA62_07260 [Rhodobiaceae bacterium]|nr:MAG: hypothetical protein COA62_07260 [Rhodobiaceae bacterium]
MKIFYRDPLIHFTALGVLLFALYALVGSDKAPQWDTRIHVDRETLLTFIQYRTRNFDRAMAETRLAALKQAERDQLVEEYVREEVLYREGLTLGLEEDDYVIRRRLIQKVEFLAEGFSSAAVEVSEAELATYFEENQQTYYVDPSITFTHVFFDKTKHGTETVALAQAGLENLNAENVLFSQAPGHGDRFPFHLNYVERTPAFVASHFGRELAEAVFALPADAANWKGVFISPYGAHLVMVTSVTQGRVPELSDVRGRVREDALRQRREEELEVAIGKIMARYDLVIDLDTGAAQ